MAPGSPGQGPACLGRGARLRWTRLANLSPSSAEDTSPLLCTAFHCAPLVSGPLLYSTVIKPKYLWILLYVLAESGRGGITNLLPSESAGGAWSLVDLKQGCIIETHNLLADQVVFMYQFA